MDEKVTLEIRTRMDQLCSGYPASRDLTELKEELVADLTEAVSEKINQGMAVDAAIDAAMAQLGDIDSLLKEVTGTTSAQSETTQEVNHESRNADQSREADDDGVFVDHNGDDVRIGGRNGLHIHGDQITWHGKKIIDHDRVHLGNLVQVDGDHVRVADGLVDVDGDNVRIAGQKIVSTGNRRHETSWDQTAKQTFRTYVESLKLVNTRHFPVTDLQQLVINYPDAAIKLGPSAQDQIVVNEYMSRDNPRYYLQADRSADRLTLHQGDRPRLWPLHIRAEIFLPASLTGKVQLDAGNGSLEISDLNQAATVEAHATNGSVKLFNNQLAGVQVQATNGSVRVDQITAATVQVSSQNGSVGVRHGQGQLTVTSHNGSLRIADFQGDGQVTSHNGSVQVNGLTGQLTGSTANGSLTVRQLRGGGTFHAHHGSLTVDVAQLARDLAADGAGNVDLTVAPDQTYHFDLKTRHGHVALPQVVHLSLNDDQHKIGTVGDAAQHQVTVVTTNGNVHLK